MNWIKMCLWLKMTNEIRYNLAGDSFHGGAHWKMIDQDGDTIEDKNIYLIEGQRLFDPTVPHNNYWGNTNRFGPRKKNYIATADREFF